MTTYYEVVVQLLRKLVRKLFNCCHVACGEKKKFWINFQLATAAKEIEQKLQI